MPRLRGVDAVQRDALASDIHGESLGRGESLARLLPHLAELAGVARGIALTFESWAEGFRARDLHVVGLDAAACQAAVKAALAGSADGAAPLLPLHPPCTERNQPVALHLAVEVLPTGAAALAAAIGVTGADALRVSLCDGADPLGWLALFRQGPFDSRERHLLGSVAAPLRARLLLERDVAEAPLTAAALHAALEAIGTPAFVLDAEGRVEHLNAPGRALLAGEAGAAEELRDCALGRARGRFTMTRLAVGGSSGGHLFAIAPATDRGLAARLAAASELWHLTRRQSEVLARVAEGHSNKTVAAELACAESTVEIHVSALLAKAGCESRAELVARFWSQTRGPSGFPVAPRR